VGYPTYLAPELFTYKIDVENVEVVLKLWDTAGQERFRAITIQFYKGSKGVFLVFDLNNKFNCVLKERQSFSDAKKWIRHLSNHLGDDFVLIILGNKSDLESQAVVSDTSEQG
jgi:small GTP-binding protein